MYMIENITDPLTKLTQTVTLLFTNKTYVEIYENGLFRTVKLENNTLTLKIAQGQAVYVIAR